MKLKKNKFHILYSYQLPWVLVTTGFLVTMVFFNYHGVFLVTLGFLVTTGSTNTSSVKLCKVCV